MQENKSKELFTLKKNNNDFEEIFKEMLGIENAKSLGSKVRYCLARVQITNLTEIPEVETLEDANRILYKVYNFLHKNLRKKDIYLLPDTGCFLVLLPDISIENASDALKRIVLLSGKEFNERLTVSWSIITGTDREEEIKSHTEKARLLSGQNGEENPGSTPKVLLKNDAANIIFKYFLAAFFSFSAFFLAFEIIIFYGTSKFANLPGYTMTENFLRNMMPGLFSYFSGPHIKSSAFFLFTSILLLSCLVFGLGMFAGFVVNLRIKNAGGPATEFTDTEKLSSHRHK
jgi:hypothetical protein